MISDKILLIPVLSKELTLIGQPSLPFKLEKPKKTRPANETVDAVKIVFDSKSMIESLTSVCLDLVKEIKLFGERDNDYLDKITFANAKLQKQLNQCKSEISKTEKKLAAEKESNRQLQEKVRDLQRQIKTLEMSEKKLVQRNQTEEDLLKHSLQKKDSELVELHKILWKQFNIVDKSYLPENLTILQSHQPDFNKLWSNVKYSDLDTRENLLKEAVCIFQKNNRILTDDNGALKTLLVTIFQEMNEVQKLMQDKMQIPGKILFNYKLEDVCPDIESLNFPLCKDILSVHLNLLKKICAEFEKALFAVGDDVFICWSDIICNLLDM